MKYSLLLTKFNSNQLGDIKPNINIIINKKTKKTKISINILDNPTSGNIIYINEKFSKSYKNPSLFNIKLNLYTLFIVLRDNSINISSEGYKSQIILLKEKITKCTLVQIFNPLNLSFIYPSLENIKNNLNESINSKITSVSPSTWTAGDTIIITGTNLYKGENYYLFTGDNSFEENNEGEPIYNNDDGTSVSLITPSNIYGNIIISFMVYENNKHKDEKIPISKAHINGFSNYQVNVPLISTFSPNIINYNTNFTINGENFTNSVYIFFCSINSDISYSFTGNTNTIDSKVIKTNILEMLGKNTESDLSKNLPKGNYNVYIYSIDDDFISPKNPGAIIEINTDL